MVPEISVAGKLSVVTSEVFSDLEVERVVASISVTEKFVVVTSEDFSDLELERVVVSISVHKIGKTYYSNNK